MSINKGWKVFEPSFTDNLLNRNITVTTGELGKLNVFNRDTSRVWQSIGSDDSTTETITINFDEETEIDTIIFVGINWKDFNVSTSNGLIDSACTIDHPKGLDVEVFNWVDDSSNNIVDDEDNNIVFVTGDSSAPGNIENYNRDTFYMGFDKQTVTSVTVEVSSTQIANKQKSLGYFIITKSVGNGSTRSELDTPTITFSNNEKVSKGLNNRSFVQKLQKTVKISIGFDLWQQSQVDLYEKLYNRQESFLFWACGGIPDDCFTLFRPEGLRFRDIYLMQITGGSDVIHNKFYYSKGKAKLKMIEVNE